MARRAADPLDSPEVLGHTREVLRLKAKLHEDGVFLGVEIGRHLLDVRALLMPRRNDPATKGTWLRWLEDRVEMEESWAYQLMSMAETAASNAAWVKSIASLGPTKVARACKASVPFRWSLSPEWTWDGKTAHAMTAREFDAALDAADPKARRRKKRGKEAEGPAIPWTPASAADVVGALAEWRKKTPDPRKWKPIFDWLKNAFGWEAAPPAAPPKPAKGSGATATPAPVATPGAGPQIQGLSAPYVRLMGVPAGEIARDGARVLEGLIALLRQVEKDLGALRQATSKANPLKAEGIDAAMDVVDKMRELPGFVAGTPRRS
jgi:hypothetical protein